MNGVHIHLVLNHLPIITPIIGLLVLLAGSILKSATVKQTAFGIFILGAIFAFPAFASGEGAEEIAEKIQGISKQLIHEHEEKAELFAILSYILGGASILGLWASVKLKSFANLLTYLVMIMAALVLFFAQQTGTSGGAIRHSEMSATPVGLNTNGIINNEAD